MFYVTSLDKTQVEPLINIGDDFKMDQTVDGVLTVSFTSFPSPNNPGYDILKPETVVNVDGYDLKVKQYSDTEYSKSIVATSTFFELGKTRVGGLDGGTVTLDQAVKILLTGTGWTYSIDPSIADIYKLLPNFGNDNRIALNDRVISLWECEYVIMPNNHIHYATEIGPDNDYQYRYKHNISDVVVKEDTANIFTVIKGTGANDITATYRSPNADIYGELEAPPFSDSEIPDQAKLLEVLRKEINDKPELAIESNSPELTNRDIGERVWLIYEPINIEMKTRILQQTKVLLDGELITSSVVLGNVIPKSTTDILIEQKVDIDKNDKIYRSKFEQTNNRITLEVEQIGVSIANITIEANQIRSEVRASVDTLNNTIDTNDATIRDLISVTQSNLADSIGVVSSDLEVKTAELDSKITQTATSIRSEVNASITAVHTDIENQKTDITAAYNSAITQSATSIRSEVNAEVLTINNAIATTNQNVSNISQRADSIQLTVSSHSTSIGGLNSSVDGLNTRVTSAESSISQNANQISLKVSQTDYNGATITNLINLDTYGATIKASKINLVGAVSVLSDISGNLGTITAGNLYLSTNATVGNELTLGTQGSASGKSIKFSNSAVIRGVDIAGIQLSGNYIAIGGGSVDFSSATGINWGTNAPTAKFG